MSSFVKGYSLTVSLASPLAGPTSDRQRLCRPARPAAPVRPDAGLGPDRFAVTVDRRRQRLNAVHGSGGLGQKLDPPQSSIRYSD